MTLAAVSVINSSPNILIFAEEASNIYDSSLDTYSKLIHDNNKTFEKRESFISLKDHKENIKINPKCRLKLNPLNATRKNK
jgi:hypothetical protein